MSNQSLVLANIILRATKRLEKLIPGEFIASSLMCEETETILRCAELIKEDNKKPQA